VLLLKSYLQTNEIKFPKKHELSVISDLAEKNGLPHLDKGLLESIQCSPGARYGDETVTLTQAYSAYWSAIQVCGHVAQALLPEPKQ